jgi:hypothetical protein
LPIRSNAAGISPNQFKSNPGAFTPGRLMKNPDEKRFRIRILFFSGQVRPPRMTIIPADI